MEQSKNTSPVTRIRNWYGRYERPISSLSLIGGFVFDALTLKRVDLGWENFWVIAHIVIVGICIVLIHAIEREEGAEANPSKLHFWLVNIQQFFYGGIWSVFLVFYFRSSDIAVSWPFLLILALSFWANESLKRSFVRLLFQVSLFFLSVFCFAIFAIPVLLHKIGTGIFLLAGLASLIFITLFILIIRYSSKRGLGVNKWLVIGSVAGIYVLVNVLYFTHAIPPLPLSVKDAGVYYSVKRDRVGNYVVDTEAGQSRNWLSLYPDFHKAAGQPVYIYSAVFAPPVFNLKIVHEWQKQDSETKDWITQSIIPLSVSGGRDGGFRTYSLKSNPSAGRWRVNVKTTEGQVIGRVRFDILAVDSKPDTLSEVK